MMRSVFVLGCLLALTDAKMSLRQQSKQEPCGNIQCPGGFVPLCYTDSDKATPGAGAYCVPDKQKVQPYGSTTHDMISEEGSDPKRSAEYWAGEAQKAYQWYRGQGGQ